MVRKIIDAIKSETGYKDKAQLLNYLYNTVSSGAVNNEVREEIGKLFLDLANAIIRDARPDRPYKENCEIIACQNAIMGISMKLWPDVSKMPLELAEAIRAMLGVMNKIRELELYVEEVCAEPKIDARVAGELTERLRKESDTFKLYDALMTFLETRNIYDHLTDEAVEIFAEYMNDTLKDLMHADMNEDNISYIELLVDAVGNFPNDESAFLLHSAFDLKKSNISYYALISLLKLESMPTPQEVNTLARDEQYAAITYSKLSENGLAALFPEELRDEVYIAKSDLINWLTYPTELGKKPDAIEYLGEVLPLLSKKPSYRIFRFISSSDTLDEESKNVWLIGWSSIDGGTFSGFDLYSDFEGKDTKETLTRVAKKLIGIKLPRVKI